MSDFRIRPATRADAHGIVELMRGLAEYEKLAGPDAAAEERFTEHAFAEDPLVRVLVAESDDTLIGYALYFFTYSTFLAKPTLFLEDLFVSPESRGRGAGKELLVELARIAERRGCGRFEWMVLDWNEPAIGFYESLGATVFDEWRLCRATGEALSKLAR
ncbi:MAG: GNAT family N-acetyltransferase [Planctomycetota bacterium]